MTLCGDALEEIEFAWLGSLKSLQDLGFHAQEDVELSAELTELTSLTNLWLTTADSETGVSCMDIQVDWRGMHTLKRLILTQDIMPLMSSCRKLLVALHSRSFIVTRFCQIVQTLPGSLQLSRTLWQKNGQI